MFLQTEQSGMSVSNSLLLLTALACSVLACSAPAAPVPITVDVWPGLAPGENTINTGRAEVDAQSHITRLTDVTYPQLTIFRPDHGQPRPAVVVCPGGGYQLLATDLEGTEIARWLNSQGIVAAVLFYRVPGKRDAAFQDVQRAVSLVRARAKEFGVDRSRIGVMGFSAGGHLSACLAAGYATRTYASVDKADRFSCRPDFALLIYPAYLLVKATGRPAPEVQPHLGMPPVFLAQTRDDPFLDAPVYAAALMDAHVPNHCVIYDVGGHGYGLRLPTAQPAHRWSDEAATWLQEQVTPRK